MHVHGDGLATSRLLLSNTVQTDHIHEKGLLYGLLTSGLRAELCSLPLTRATTTPSEEGRRRSHGAVLTFGTLNLAIEEAHTPSGLKRTRELNGKLLLQLTLNHVEEKAARRRHFASPCLASTLFSSAAHARGTLCGRFAGSHPSFSV